MLLALTVNELTLNLTVVHVLLVTLTDRLNRMINRKDVIEHLELLLQRILPIIAVKVDEIVQLTITELPKWEALVLEILEIMFSPRQLFRQVVIISAVQLLIMAGVAMQETGNSLVRFLSKAEREQKEIEDDLSRAVSYREWKEVAGKLDFTRGNDKWRLQDESSLYDCNVLRKRIDDTMEMAKQGDVFRLMFRLRGGLARDQYGNILFTLSFIYQLSI